MNVSEYLDHYALAIREKDFVALQPIHQKRIRDNFKTGDGEKKLAEVIEQLKNRIIASTWKAAVVECSMFSP